MLFPAQKHAKHLGLFLFLCLLGMSTARASDFSQLQGVVHDPQHRPLPGAHITLAAAHSDFTQSTTTNSEGAFTLPSIPLGDYTVTISHAGFQTLQQTLTLYSDTSPILHFQLEIGKVSQTVTVTAPVEAASIDTVTPTTLVDRLDIAQTPGADRTNSMAMITDYVPGAYMTHDMLHMRGGHQVPGCWTASRSRTPTSPPTSAPQIDPKDIDYLEVQRGSYTADIGDRIYGVFNVVPRTGFERDRQAELVLSAGNFFQTNDQLSFGDHTEKFAWYTSLNGNRSDYGLLAAHRPGRSTMPPTATAASPPSSTTARQGPVAPDHASSAHDFFQIPYDPDPTASKTSSMTPAVCATPRTRQTESLLSPGCTPSTRPRAAGFALLPLQPGQLQLASHRYTP